MLGPFEAIELGKHGILIDQGPQLPRQSADVHKPVERENGHALLVGPGAQEIQNRTRFVSFLPVVGNDKPGVHSRQIHHQQQSQQQPARPGPSPVEIAAEHQGEQPDRERQEKDEPAHLSQTERRDGLGHCLIELNLLQISQHAGASGAVDQPPEQTSSQGERATDSPLPVKGRDLGPPSLQLGHQIASRHGGHFQITVTQAIDTVGEDNQQHPLEDMHELARIANRGGIGQSVEELVEWREATKAHQQRNAGDAGQEPDQLALIGSENGMLLAQRLEQGPERHQHH